MNKKEKVKLPKKKLVNRITTIVLGSLAGLLLFFQVFGLITARSNHGVQRFGNYQMLTVLTDSMEPVLPIDVGIIIKRVPANQIKGPSSEDAMDGDIITYFRRSDGLIITHRVIEKIENDGKFTFKTFGDNKNAETCSQFPNGVCDQSTGKGIDTIKEEDVLGVWIKNSKALGLFVKFTRNPFTIIIVGLVPLLYVFISSLFDISKNVKERKEETEKVSVDFEGLDEFEKIKQQEKLKLLIEKEKEKLRSSSEERRDEDEK
ncbi:MAG: hypothetical protein WCZ47_03905 [Bacilli bacterium]|jgi:signal peptidase|nr:hypothetical protein [Bacilli bacterium]NLN80446.1 hypothetical protein [Erysipelotrichia bacterium]